MSYSGLIDIPYTILDLLAIDLPEKESLHKSMRHEYSENREILFEQYAAAGPGTIYEILENGDIRVFRTENKNLYTEKYEVEILSGVEADNIRKSIMSLYGEKNGQSTDSSNQKTHLLIKDKEFALTGSQKRTLSTGQYLSMPENSVATLDLRAEAPASREEEDTDRSPHLSIELQLTREGSHFDVKVPEMPDLGEGDSLEFSFSFSTREELSRIWAVLSVENLRSDKNSLLHIPRFAVSVDQGAQLDEPRVNTLRVEEIEK